MIQKSLIILLLIDLVGKNFFFFLSGEHDLLVIEYFSDQENENAGQNKIHHDGHSDIGNQKRRFRPDNDQIHGDDNIEERNKGEADIGQVDDRRNDSHDHEHDHHRCQIGVCFLDALGECRNEKPHRDEKEQSSYDQEEQDDKIARKMESLREKQERKKNKKAKAQQAAAQQAVLPKPSPLTAGEYVKIKGQTTVGQILEINERNAIVMFGLMKTNVKTERLERTEVPKQSGTPAKTTFVSNETQEHMHEKRLNFKQDIDVRGMRGDEAIQAVTYFIDDAILVGVSRVRILHGTGNGILRTLIRQYLATVPGVAHFQDEHVQFGGAGITVVDLK